MASAARAIRRIRGAVEILGVELSEGDGAAARAARAAVRLAAGAAGAAVRLPAEPLSPDAAGATRTRSTKRAATGAGKANTPSRAERATSSEATGRTRAARRSERARDADRSACTRATVGKAACSCYRAAACSHSAAAAAGARPVTRLLRSGPAGAGEQACDDEGTEKGLARSGTRGMGRHEDVVAPMGWWVGAPSISSVRRFDHESREKKRARGGMTLYRWKNRTKTERNAAPELRKSR